MNHHKRRLWILGSLLAATCASTQAANLIDPLLDGDDAIEALAKMDCPALSESSHNAECSYGALAESAAYFDACLPLLEQRHGKTLGATERERFYAPLISWSVLAPASIRSAVLDRNNNLRRTLAAIATEMLTALDDAELDQSCSDRIARVARHDEPLSLSTILWKGPSKEPALSAPAQTQSAVIPVKLDDPTPR